MQEGRKRALAGRAGVGAFKGAVTEVPTEIGQTILTRIQAGKPIDSEEAYREYLEVGIAAGIVGGTVRGTIDAVKGEKENTVGKTQLEADRREEIERARDGVAQNAEYDELSNRAANLTEIDDPQIGVLEQDAIPFNAEDIPPESRATVLSGINESCNQLFPCKNYPILARQNKKKFGMREPTGETRNPVEILKYQKYRKLLASGPLTVLRGSKNP